MSITTQGDSGFLNILKIVLKSTNHDLQKRDLFQLALVSKTWSEIALDFIWSDLNSLRFDGVFKILAPLKSARGNHWLSFSRDIQPDDWSRFDNYARRIVSLELDPEPMYSPVRLEDTVYEALRTTQPRGPGDIFPNLKSLWIYNKFGVHANLFMSSSVETLRVTFYDPDHDNGHDLLLQTIASSRMCHLKVLEFRVWVEMPLMSYAGNPFHPIYPLENSICRLLHQQTLLERLLLPKHWLTTRVAQSISHLPNLKVIGFPAETYTVVRIGHPLESLYFNYVPPGTELSGGLPVVEVIDDDTIKLPPAQLPTFPALCSLSISVPYSAFQAFLLQWSASSENPTRLETFELRSQTQESPETMQSLLETLSSCCPALCSLHLSSMCSSYQPLFTDTNSPFRIAIEKRQFELLLPYRVQLSTISPLFQLQRLRVLRLHHHLPAAFSLSDLEVIADNLSSLSVIELFPDPHPMYLGEVSEKSVFVESLPIYGSYPELRILELRQSLRTFGTRCPHLKALGIFVCAHVTDEVLFETEKQDSIADTSRQLDDLRVSESGTLEEASTRPTERSGCSTANGTNERFLSLRQLSFGTSPCDGDPSSIALVLSDYIPPDTEMSSKAWWGRMSGFIEYVARLEKGGKLLDPLPVYDSTSQSVQQTSANGRYEKETWKTLPDGSPLPDDAAVLVNDTGEPLSFDVQQLGSSTGVNERLVPGVSSGGLRGRVADRELGERESTWLKVGHCLAVAGKMVCQEKARAIRFSSTNM